MQWRNIHICFVMAVAVLFSACGKDSCLKSTGNITRESRQLPRVRQINLYNRVNVILTQDAKQSIVVEAGEHLLNDIETSVSGNVLTIRNNSKCNWARDLDPSINVYISIDSLDKISYYGAGNINSTNTLLATNLTIESWSGIGSIKLNVKAYNTQAIVHQDNADITLRGSSPEVYAYCAQEGVVDLRDLAADLATVESKSINDVYVNVNPNGKLNAKILYKGNVYYRGHPAQIDTTQINSGRLIQIP